MRLWHVLPGRTVYTRLQLVVSLCASLLLNFVSAILFLQTQQCSALATAFAGGIGGLVSCVFSVLVRLAFRLARDARTKRQPMQCVRTSERAMCRSAASPVIASCLCMKDLPVSTWPTGPHAICFVYCLSTTRAHRHATWILRHRF